METCTACGEPIGSTPVWAQLGDKGDRDRIGQGNEQPFPLHTRCYPKGGKVKVAEWLPAETLDGPPVLREFETQRYVKVKAPS